MFYMGGLANYRAALVGAAANDFEGFSFANSDSRVQEPVAA